jgi:hypothetical protein
MHILYGHYSHTRAVGLGQELWVYRRNRTSLEIISKFDTVHGARLRVLLLGAQKYPEVPVQLFLEPHCRENKVFTCTDPLHPKTGK